MVVVKDSKSKAVRAHALKNKSAKLGYGAKRICGDLEEWGYLCTSDTEIGRGACDPSTEEKDKE